MEGREDFSSEGLEGFRLAPRTSNPNHFGGPTISAAAGPIATPPAPPPATATAPAPATADSPAFGAAATTADGKKKRGRPRKYGPDGKLVLPLSPMPISSSVPLTGDFSAWKRGRGKLNDSIKKSHKHELLRKQLEPEASSGGERTVCYVGSNFTPHLLTVNAGEDVSTKIMLFSQQGAWSICILSANGTISNVTLRRPTSSGGTLTYEGRFEILSLSGGFMPIENGGPKSRAGGMSVSLAGPDGRVLGGGIAGLLVAASPVQVVVGSFLQGHQMEHKPKKPRAETVSPVIRTNANPISGEELRGAYGGAKPILSSFNGNNSAPLNHMPEGAKNSTTDNNMSSPGDESKGLSQSNCELSC